MKRPYRRRQYITDRGFQLRCMAAFALVCLVGTVSSALLFNFLAAREIEALRWKMAIHSDNLTGILLPYIVYISVLAAVLTTAAIVAVWRVQRRRTAAVLARLKGDLEKAGGGDLSFNIMLRDDELFQDTAESLDELVAALRRKFKKLRGDFREVKKTVDTLKDVREDLLPEKCALIREGVCELEDIAESINSRGEDNSAPERKLQLTHS